ncbi:phosphoribosylanthranilate isomerase [Alcaligenaceae bacterium]|nr:phosphoribosylanthranilate isomerase [Alcaligenaceae bacterium]
MSNDSIPARTRVKICGLTRAEDIDSAVQAGADAIGMVFYPGSRRAVTIAQARRLRAAVPPFVSVVTLFVNAAPQMVNEIIDQVHPDLLQFHGDETVEFCDQFHYPYLRAFRVGGPGMDSAKCVGDACRGYMNARAWLFDSYSAGYGGSGKGFDTGLLDAVVGAEERRPLVLAGGLSAETVAERIRRFRPYAVDVSSGVEIEPGIKSAEKIQAFIKAVQNA